MNIVKPQPTNNFDTFYSNPSLQLIDTLKLITIFNATFDPPASAMQLNLTASEAYQYVSKAHEFIEKIQKKFSSFKKNRCLNDEKCQSAYCLFFHNLLVDVAAKDGFYKTRSCRYLEHCRHWQLDKCLFWHPGDLFVDHKEKRIIRTYPR